MSNRVKSVTHLVGVFLVTEPGFPTRLALRGFFPGVTSLLGVIAFAGVFEVVEGVTMRDFLELTRQGGSIFEGHRPPHLIDSDLLIARTGK